MSTRLMRKVRKLVYAMGFRPKATSPFYSYLLETEEQWRTGKK